MATATKRPAAAITGFHQFQQFEVRFDRKNGCYAAAMHQGYKVIPWHDAFQPQVGQTWLVEVTTWWQSGTSGKGNGHEGQEHWGNVVYVRPVRRVR